jgi:hypothetical protein
VLGAGSAVSELDDHVPTSDDVEVLPDPGVGVGAVLPPEVLLAGVGESGPLEPLLKPQATAIKPAAVRKTTAKRGRKLILRTCTGTDVFCRFRIDTNHVLPRKPRGIGL